MAISGLASFLTRSLSAAPNRPSQSFRPCKSDITILILILARSGIIVFSRRRAQCRTRGHRNNSVSSTSCAFARLRTILPSDLTLDTLIAAIVSNNSHVPCCGSGKLVWFMVCILDSGKVTHTGMRAC